MPSKIKTLVIAGALLASGHAGIEEASATPISRDAGIAVPAPIDQVRFGCGPGWHPNPWGRCVPNGRAFYAPRRHYRRW